MKAWFLKLHRWLALIFAAPLAVVIVTGLILSFEPWLVTGAIKPGALTPQKIQALLAEHDPQGQARAIFYRSYDGTLTLRAGRGGGSVVDAMTGELRPRQAALTRVFGTARGLHERLLIDAGWLVTASTVVMLIIIVLGVLMGWPRFRNTLGGMAYGHRLGALAAHHLVAADRVDAGLGRDPHGRAGWRPGRTNCAAAPGGSGGHGRPGS